MPNIHPLFPTQGNVLCIWVSYERSVGHVRGVVWVLCSGSSPEPKSEPFSLLFRERILISISSIYIYIFYYYLLEMVQYLVHLQKRESEQGGGGAIHVRHGEGCFPDLIIKNPQIAAENSR